MMMAGQCTPHFLFDLAEKKTGRARSKRKERFGGSGRIYASLLPPAREGWHSLAEVRDGNARPLGKPPARGSWGYPQPPSPLPLTLLRRTASGSEKRSSSMRQPPRRRSTIRHGTAVPKVVEESSVPEGGPKSALAPIRRPPSRAEGHCTGARPSGLFFWTVHGPFSFPQDGKENGGCIPLDKPPAGAESPAAAVRRPIPLPAGIEIFFKSV